MLHRAARAAIAVTMAVPLLTTTPACVIRARSPVWVVDVEPPPPRPVVVAPRPGYVWIEGNWEWDGHWRWRDGYWERERAGHVWIGGRWVRSGNHWNWHAGRWQPHNQPRPQVRDHRDQPVRDHRDEQVRDRRTH